MEAIYTFTPDADDQIALEVGDHITQANEMGNGWMIGHNLTQNKYGMFPASYVRKQHGFRAGARRSFARINSVFGHKSRQSREAIPVSAPTAAGGPTSRRKGSRDNLTPTIDEESKPVYDNYQDIAPNKTGNRGGMRATNDDPGRSREGQTRISDAYGQYVCPDQVVAPRPPPRPFKHKQKPTQPPKLAHYLSMNDAQSTTSCNQTDDVSVTSPPALPQKPPPASPKPRKPSNVQPMAVVLSFVIVISIVFMMASAFHYAFRLPLVVTISVSCVAFVLLFLGSVLWIHGRCSLALVFPNLASTCGQVVILSVITAVLLHGPITNIIQNIGAVRQAVRCVDIANGRASVDQLSNGRASVDQLSNGRASVDQLSHRDILRYHFTHFSERLDDFIKIIPYLDEASRQIFQRIAMHLEELEGVLDGITHGTAESDTTCQQGLQIACQRDLDGIKVMCESYLERTIDNKAPWHPGWKVWCYSATTDMCAIFSSVCDARAGDRPTQDRTDAFGLFAAWRRTFELLVMQMSIPPDGSLGTNATNNVTISPGRRWLFGYAPFIERTQTAVYWIAVCLTVAIVSIFVYSVVFTVKWYTNDDFDNLYFRPSSKEERTTRTSVRFVDMLSRTPSSIEIGRMQPCVLIIVLHLLLVATVCLVDAGLFLLTSTSNGTAKVENGRVTAVGTTATIKFSYTTPGPTRGVDRGRPDMRGKPLYPGDTGSLVDKMAPTNDAMTKLSDCRPLLSESYGNYLAIAILYGVSFLLLLAQPYILRTRHLIACSFFPERARERSQYLCTCLRKSRDRRLQELPETVKLNKIRCDRRKEVVDRLACCSQAKWVLGFMLGCLPDQTQCLVCGKGKLSIKQNCAMENCDGVYCDCCFQELDRNCPLCQ